MTTLRALSSRLDRIEDRRQRQATSVGTQPTVLPTPTPDEIRVILRTLVEAGVFLAMDEGDPLWPLRCQLFGNGRDTRESESGGEEATP
jgi:hypothetical protein